MKAIRFCLIVVGLNVAFFVAGVTGASAQALNVTEFSGTISLPVETQWQGATLPAGTYSLYYGTRVGGTYYLELDGKTHGTSHVFIMPQAHNPDPTASNELVCARDGKHLIVMGLKMRQLGESVSFATPRGLELMVQQPNDSKGRRVAETAMRIQRIPVALKK